MLKVTFQAQWVKKERRKKVPVISRWTEDIKDEGSARLRALALNWQIIKIEPAHGVAS